MPPRQRRHPWDEFWAFAQDRGLNMKRLVVEAKADYRDLARWRAAGEIPEAAADRMAVAMGMHPGDIWAGWHAIILAEQDARRREMAAARKRRARGRHPERERAARARRYQESREYYQESQRRYYEENAEQERARKRAERAVKRSA